MVEKPAFGTSGLRGPADGFDAAIVGAYVTAFLATSCQTAREKTLAIAWDRRASSPAIAARVAAAAQGAGWQTISCGEIPTPALAHFSLGRAIPAIMVTGSHIPARYNGLKFYRPEGELRKADEAPIRVFAEARLMEDWPEAEPHKPVVDDRARKNYRERFLSAFAPDALAGLTLGVFTHSAVGRDDLVAILKALGARCEAFGASDDFFAVDTEAVGAEHLEVMRQALRAHGCDAVVSTDGDGDRPLLLSEDGAQVNGDIIGALAARALGAKTIVTPLTSTSAIEASGWFETVIRTRIGSPYVIAAMETATGSDIIGFEANGGFLTQTTLTRDGRAISALPTRDALLPIIAVLADAKSRQEPISALAAHLPPRAMRADRLKDVPQVAGQSLVARLAEDEDFRRRLDPALATPAAIDRTDGTRLTLSDGRIVHVRQSGNAPELRCYVEADTNESAREMLAAMIARLETLLETLDG